MVISVIQTSDRRVLSATLLLCAVGVVVGALASGKRAAVDAAQPDTQLPSGTATPPDTRPDLSGRKRTGKASFYGKQFNGRKMADGTPMDPHDDNAASKTLPLGTTAKVTNVETGQSAEVTIQDRGPYVKGRIIDLSPATAREIGLDRHDGITTVVVSPIEVPLPDGGVKQGAAAGDTLR
jgi:rare lipoprotein A